MSAFRRFAIPGAAASAALLAYLRVVRPWYLRWGATDDELRASLPGDDLVPEPRYESTRAIAINASAEDVWPWLVQMGQHRAGFYSYTWLENIFGTHMRNADRIVPEWQEIAPGDRVWLHPLVALDVLRVEPGRAIVLSRSWAFVVEPVDERRSRLIVRGRGLYEMPDLKLAPLNFLYFRLIFEPAHFIMERGMLRGIQRRAERLAAQRRAEAAGARPVA